MMKTRCISCNGSGRLMGGGMLMHDCDHCDGKGFVLPHVKGESEPFIMTDKEYQKAKSQIQEKYPELPDNEVEELLNDALADTSPKKGRRKN